MQKRILPPKWSRQVYGKSGSMAGNPTYVSRERLRRARRGLHVGNLEMLSSKYQRCNYYMLCFLPVCGPRYSVSCAAGATRYRGKTASKTARL